nr:hypothetical protein [Deltaproteobacteria bacterium]
NQGRRPPTNPGFPPPPSAEQQPPPVRHAPAPPPPPLFTPRTRPPTQPPAARRRNTQPRTVMPGLTAPTPKEWIRQLIDDHSPPDRARSRVVTPGRVAGAGVPDWMLDMIDTEFPDDDNDK